MKQKTQGMIFLISIFLFSFLAFGCKQQTVLSVIPEEPEQPPVQEPVAPVVTPPAVEPTTVPQPIPAKDIITFSSIGIQNIGSDTLKPLIYDDYIVRDNKLYKISDKTTDFISINPVFAVYKDTVVYSDYNQNIYLYDLKAKEAKLMLKRSSNIDYVSIYGDFVAWSEGLRVYLYNTKTSQLTTLSESGIRPVVGSKYAAWTDARNNNIQFSKTDIYAYNLAAGEEKKVTSDFIKPQNHLLSIYDNKIAYANSGDNNLFDVFVINIDSGETKQLSTDPNDQVSPSIYKNIVVWQDYREKTAVPGSYDVTTQIYLYDLETGNETAVTSGAGGRYSPQIFGNHIVWYQRDGIYLATLNP